MNIYKMEPGNKCVVDLSSGNHKEVGSASASVPSQSPYTNSVQRHSTPSTAMEFPCTSDLLIAASPLGETTKLKIENLAMSAMKELLHLATVREPLWQTDAETGSYFLNQIEYKNRFIPLDPTLEHILKMISSEGPFELPDLNYNLDVMPEPDPLQSESSQETALICTMPLDLVRVFMDVDQWSLTFSDIVSKAELLQGLSTGEQTELDGAKVVINAEFHVPSPLVKTRECTFVRMSKQVGSENVWAVVDVSLESIFPNPTTRFIRRPSGCIIEGLQDGYSRVKWIEHVEVDSSRVPQQFKLLITSGFAFGAHRWVGTLARRCDRLAAFKDDRVTKVKEGRKSLLKLADRMMRRYYEDISASSSDNEWKSIPGVGYGNYLVSTRFNNDPGTPYGVSVKIATTFSMSIKPKTLFDFLRDGKRRSQWDLLSLNQRTEEIAHVSTGRHSGNNVSIIATDTSARIFYLQESHSDSTGSYVVYAPLDVYTMNAVLDGECTCVDNIRILSSGFSILPDRQQTTLPGRVTNGGSLLTIAFHVADENATTAEYLSEKAIKTLLHMVNKTFSLILTSEM